MNAKLSIFGKMHASIMLADDNCVYSQHLVRKSVNRCAG